MKNTSKHNMTLWKGFSGMVQDSDGTQRWYENDQLHRENGPAVIRPNGVQEWYWKGRRHRIGGVAFSNTEKIEGHYIQGRFISPKEYAEEVLKMHKVFDGRETAPYKIINREGNEEHINLHPKPNKKKTFGSGAYMIINKRKKGNNSNG